MARFANWRKPVPTPPGECNGAEHREKGRNRGGGASSFPNCRPFGLGRGRFPDSGRVWSGGFRPVRGRGSAAAFVLESPDRKLGDRSILPREPKRRRIRPSWSYGGALMRSVWWGWSAC
ncbi:hypothetical protein NL676_021562 [Syzygium grande]|nr:hypothetical protein NL676_021562 [Syzygium grande]